MSDQVICVTVSELEAALSLIEGLDVPKIMREIELAEYFLKVQSTHDIPSEAKVLSIMIVVQIGKPPSEESKKIGNGEFEGYDE